MENIQNIFQILNLISYSHLFDENRKFFEFLIRIFIMVWLYGG